MENKITELVFILDKSGSMSGKEADTIGGFNSMMEKQKQLEGKVIVSTVLFSNYSKVLHNRKNLDEINALTEEDYQVGGCTALLDAIGNAINHIDMVQKNLKEKDVPDQTIFVITTDGLENASREYTATLVKKMIQEHEKENGWEFLFLAANIDAVETGEHIGIRAERAANYSLGKSRHMYASLAEAIYYSRINGELASDWSKDIEEGIVDEE
ncbi:MAG TPA: hypothetical protein DDY77_06635 [Clostridiales bacterium]|nr:hypothetical protein [Clostridiales bacterium]